MEVEQILGLIQETLEKWKKWQNVYEHGPSVSTNPLLVDKDKFERFCSEYRVTRTIRHNTRDDLRIELSQSRQFLSALQDGSGKGLDQYELDLRPRFGTRNGERGLISALSKIAMFMRPEQFVPWDQYAKKGLKILLKREASFQFNSYADYLSAFEEVWNGQAGRKIRDCIDKYKIEFAVEKESRFQRQVLDVYLMKIGGFDRL